MLHHFLTSHGRAAFVLVLFLTTLGANATEKGLCEAYLDGDSKDPSVLDSYNRDLSNIPTMSVTELKALSAQIHDEEVEITKIILQSPLASEVLSAFQRELNDQTIDSSDFVLESKDPQEDLRHLTGVLKELGRAETTSLTSVTHGFYKKLMTLFIERATDAQPSTRQALIDVEKRRKVIKKIREKILKGNLRLALKSAKERGDKLIPLEDRIQAANIGLMRAIESYEISKGAMLSSYAWHWTNVEIRRAVLRGARTIPLAPEAEDKVWNIGRASERLRRELHREPTLAEIAKAKEVDISEKEVADLLIVSKKPTSFDMPIGEDGDDTWGSITAPETSVDAGEMIDRRRQNERLKAALATLTKKERYIIEHHYEIGDAEPMSLEEIGKSLGISREWTRQMEIKALAKVRDIVFKSTKKSAR